MFNVLLCMVSSFVLITLIINILSLFIIIHIIKCLLIAPGRTWIFFFKKSYVLFGTRQRIPDFPLFKSQGLHLGIEEATITRAARFRRASQIYCCPWALHSLLALEMPWKSVGDWTSEIILKSKSTLSDTVNSSSPGHARTARRQLLTAEVTLTDAGQSKARMGLLPVWKQNINSVRLIFLYFLFCFFFNT